MASSDETFVRVVGPASKIYLTADSLAAGSPLIIKLNSTRRCRIAHSGNIELAGKMIFTSVDQIGDDLEFLTGE